MASQSLKDMTLEELTHLIDLRIQQVISGRHDKRSMTDVNSSIRRNRWTPAPGAKSPRELLRDDRDA
jgi:hypothetical protein